MSVVRGQQQTVLHLLQTLRPHCRTEPNLPNRIQALFARHKEFGSRDRRLYRELLYTTLRYLPWIERHLDADPMRAVRFVAWLAAETRDTARFRAETCPDWPALATVAERAAFLEESPTSVLPDWVAQEAPPLLQPPELDAQVARAPLWLRVRPADAEDVRAEFTERGWTWRESEVVPEAWRLLDEVDLTKTESYEKGRCEIQDLGSQLVLAGAPAAPGQRWFDACAGAGGKTLQLAALVGDGGRVEAHDIRPAALSELRLRANRARLRNVHVVGRPEGVYDGVLVDAPCSGSGTWRRAPHLKWITSADTLHRRAALQRELLDRYAAAVRPGGVLVYATCSLARSENNGVIADFLAHHADFAAGNPAAPFAFERSPDGATLWPATYDTDGFFVAVLHRRAAV
jgi:16S rRNA (cytosine967-C5)-methyltransferase